MLVLNRKEVASLLTMSEAIAAMEEAFAAVSARAVVQPQRLVTPVPDRDGLHLTMPCYAQGVLSAKLVTVYPRNPAEFGLPRVQATLLLYDGETGALRALMDAEQITALRTGAASGLATRLLAREDARTLLMVGAGALAPFQIEAVCAVRAIERVWVTSRGGRRAAELAARLSARFGIPASVPEVMADALRQADVICTATNSQTPLFSGELVQPGTHINAVGAFTPAMAELEPSLVRRSAVYVDEMGAAAAEAGDLIQALLPGETIAQIVRGELGILLAADHPARRNPAEITIFKSVGLAAQDLYCAERIYAAALERGAGQQIELA